MSYFSAEQLKALEIFYPYALGKQAEALSSGRPFVHYCSSAAALSMIQSQQVWMRNVTWMNDSSEIAYGKSCLYNALQSDWGEKLAAILDEMFPGFSPEFATTFNSWVGHFEQETYITCLTELLENEDTMGRLSMWRAYGAGANPVAFVVNSGPFLRPSSALSAYTSPVAYLTQAQFDGHYAQVAQNIAENRDSLVSLGREEVFGHLFAAFRYAIVCTKHPSFHEEREWRIVYQPTFEASERLVPDTTVIAGAPQRIFKIPLVDYPEEGFYGATLPHLFRKLLIGPSASAENLRREFVFALTSAGVPNAAEKVVISDVPLRV
ncbi:DUF2971 domain-containing protein [Sinorhizobium medicae]|nr:DUF2971 domain-containing protein [Sinorhizobium medicae]MDX0836856.1 DUF2971 domain-containing protein [Sinorhizobium medicae]